MKVMLKTGSS